MRKQDIYLMLVLLAMAVGGLWWQHHRAPGVVLEVVQAGRVVQRIPLANVRSVAQLEIPVTHGVFKLAYDAQGAQVVSSPCPDHVCMRTGEISRTGQSIACVPEQILVRLTGGGEGGEPDAVVR